MSSFIEDNLSLVIITGFVLNALVLYLIINIATKADKRAKYEWAQMELLAKIARSQGVAEDEIRATLDAIK